jgi:hypothetical protein
MTTPQRLAVLVVALILGGLGAGAVTDAPDAPAETSAAAAEADDAAATHPFLQDEVAFHASPGVNALLFGMDTGDGDPAGVVASKTQAHALAILNRPCGEQPDLVAVPDSIVGAAARAGATGVDPGTVRGLKTVAVEAADAPVATDLLPGCPVELTMHAPVGAAATGRLMAALPAKNVPSTVEPPAGAPAVTSDVLVTYSVTQFFSPGAYLLLAGSALLVTVAGLVPLTDHTRVRTLQAGVDKRTYPILAALATALAAVSGGTVGWSDLVPSLHLGGITVTVLLAGVLVAVGEAVVSSAEKAFVVGHALRVYGIAVLALLTPLVLLHGSTIGWGGAVVWVAVMVVLGVAACFMVLSKDTPSTTSGTAPGRPGAAPQDA